MTITVMRQLEKMALLGAIFFLPISNLPKRFAPSFISHNLAEVFAVVGLVLLVVEYFQFGFPIPKKAKYFILIFTGWQFLCLGIGFISYPYHDLIMVENSRFFQTFAIISASGLSISKYFIENLWLFYRSAKIILLDANMVFYVAFLVYHLYHDNYQEAFYDFRKAVLAIVIVMGMYSLIELCWIKTNNEVAKDLLKIINPFFYDPKIAHGWWPPLLWEGQLRSITCEPSFFGIVGVFCLPFLWSYLFEKKHIMSILIFYFSLMIFATNARTAIVIALAELLLLAGSSLLAKKKDYTKYVAVILGISVFAFLGNLVNVNSLFHGFNKNTSMSVGEYYETNIRSLSKKDSRSNSARFANLEANINAIKEHPVTGVGTGLTDGYIDAHIPESAYSNNEVRNWSRYLHMLGIPKASFPKLNKYAFEGIKNGIPGLGLYLLPFFYLAAKILKYKERYLKDPCLISLEISLAGQLACWMSNVEFSLIKGILLGILFCVPGRCFQVEKRKRNNEILL